MQVEVVGGLSAERLASAQGSSHVYCPASGGMLAPGATCVISVTFNANGSLQQNGSFSLTFTGAVTAGAALFTSCS